MSQKVQQIVDETKQEIQSQSQLNSNLKKIEPEVLRTIDSNKDEVEWYINDHGSDHAERVEQNVDDVERTLEDADVSRKLLGRRLTQEEKFEARVGGLVHDVGRAMGSKEDHPEVSAQYVLDNEKLPLTDKQRSVISTIARLHADGATKKIYGTDNLEELADKGVISKEEAYLASIVRIADALDVGKERVRHNTQGQPIQQVVGRIKRELPESEQKTTLSHIKGHQGINNSSLTDSKNGLELHVSLDSEQIKSDGDVAYRVKDIVRDLSSTVIHGKYAVRLTATNRTALKEWYDRHGDVLYDDLRDTEVYLGVE
jgi:hypothetical protein